MFTWTVTHRALHPAFAGVPYAVVVTELEEGVRLVSGTRDIRPEDLALDMPVDVVPKTYFVSAARSVSQSTSAPVPSTLMPSLGNGSAARAIDATTELTAAVLRPSEVRPTANSLREIS